MSIEEVIYHHARETPEKVAIISGAEQITYAELWESIKRVAGTLLERMAPGDRIILSANKEIDFIYTYFGAHLAHLITVPIDSETNVTRLQRIVDTATPKLIIGNLKYDGGKKITPFSEICKSKAPLESIIFPDEKNISDILFTTGTTGLPKGVALSFHNQMIAASNINSFIGNTDSDIELLALPISHSFGLGRMRCVFLAGGTLVLLNGFASMKKFYGELDRCKVTGFGMVPASWSYIQKMSKDRIANYAHQLRYIEIGSSFMSLSDKEHLMTLLPNTRICMHYGLTEASRSCFISFHHDKNALSSVGKASPNVDIKVFDEKGAPVSDGSDGEICVKGEHVCTAYWGVPDEIFHQDFNGNYFKTGDWGHIDSDGYVYLQSRKKEIINVGGKKVSPIEVEEQLNQIEHIKESACVGIFDAVLGEVVKAYIVSEKHDIDFNQVVKLLGSKLENYKIPVKFEYIDALPKTQNGKIQRHLLKEKN